MCARYNIRTANRELLQVFTAEYDPTIDLDVLHPRYDVRPSQRILAVRPTGEQGERQLTLLQWGLILPWAKSAKDYPRPSNSRDDKLTGPMYSSLLKRRRCVIPMDGFYEWPILRNGEKAKVMLERRDKRPIAVAGLWDRFEKGEEPVETATMVTTVPNAYTEQIHDRMIVILQDENAVDRWLDPAVTDPAKLMPLVKPCDPDFLIAYPVQYESLESPDCIKPIGEAFEMNDPRAQSQIDMPEPAKKKATRKNAAKKE